MDQAIVDPRTTEDPTRSSSERASTVVIGAGLGGLLAAIEAATPGSRVVVLDPHPPGGRARCDDRGGFLFNRGARALYLGGPAQRSLRAAGVDTTLGGPPNLDASAVGVVEGQTHRFPTGPIASLRTTLLTPRQKLQLARLAAALWRADDAATTGRSVADWLDERGAQGVVRQFIEALVRVATYANAPSTFASGPAFGNVRAALGPGVRYLDGGWQTLVDRLLVVAADRGIEVVDARATSVQAGPRSVRVVADGTEWTASSVIVAAGGPDAAAAMLAGAPASWGTLAPPVTAACLELGIRGVPAHRFALGIDEPVYGSTHCPPADLAPDGHSVVHLMRYQPVGDDIPAAEQRIQLEQLARQMGIAPEAVVEERFLARMVVAGTLPHPDSGGLAGRPAVAVVEHPGVFLTGDWVGPTGLLLDAVASSATEAGRQAAARSATMASA